MASDGMKLAIAREADTLPPGAVLAGRYETGGLLSRDALCLRYACRDCRAGRTVELYEFFPADFAARVMASRTVSPRDASCGERFFAGANAFYQQAKSLLPLVGSSNLLCVRDCFFENGTAYAVCDSLSGCTLEEYCRMRGGCITEGEALCILSAVSDGLLVAHSARLLHLGIRPAHIFLSREGSPRLIGFGAAERALRNEAPPSLPEADASEQDAPEPWTDIRMLGESIYLALTGRQAPAQDAVSEAALQPVPEALRSTMARMLTGDERARFSSLFGLLHALNGIDVPQTRPVVDDALYENCNRREEARLAAEGAAHRRKLRTRWALAASALALLALCIFVLVRYL